MRNLRAAILVGCAALAPSIAQPASAATVLLTGPSTTSGIMRFYTSGTGSDAVSFSVVGLTYSGTNIGSLTPSVSSAPKYAEGLGVNPSGDNRHTVDNSVKYDFILLRFDKDVQLTGAKFANSNWYGDSKPDTDASISSAVFDYDGFINPLLDQTYATSLSGTAKTNFFNAVRASFGANMFSSNSLGWGTETRTFNDGPMPNVGNVWIVGASISNLDRKVDSFKLQSVTYHIPTVVPEPSTWAMLIVGMGVVGGSLRRRSKARLSIA